MSMLEILVTCIIGSVVLGVVLAFWSGGVKMNKAAQSSVTLQNAMILQEAILQDVRQMGNDPTRPQQFLLGASSLSFFKCFFRGRDMDLIPVKYGVVPSRGGNRLLRRTESGSAGPAVKTFDLAPLSSLMFSLVGDSLGNRYIRVTMEVLENDRAVRGDVPAALRDRSSRHSLVVRVPTYSMLGDPMLSKVSGFRVLGDLLPLDP